MNYSYLIGMGGTGAKCVESFVHLAAAGLCPTDNPVWIRLVDQDQSNGNLTRTSQLLSLYQEKVRGGLRSGQSRMEGTPLFRTGFDYPEGNLFWCPVPGEKSLSDLFDSSMMKPELKGLFHALFPTRIRNMNLIKGFNGEPSAGSAIFLSTTLGDADFWSNLTGTFKNINAQDNVRIFLVASIFGGTGAAVFPTLARLLRKVINKHPNRKSFRLGGALMMPYFLFPPPDEKGFSSEAPTARPDRFLETAHASLKHYHRMLAGNQVFDGLYLLGWSPMVRLYTNPCPGGADQENPPLLPELYAALAASTFFQDPRNGYHYIGRREDRPFSWADLPPVAVSGGEGKVRTPREYIGSLVRFAFAYLTSYHPYLARDQHSAYKKQPWYLRHILKKEVNLDRNEAQEVLNNLALYCERLLSWVASLSCCTGGIDVKLVGVPSFSPRPAEGEEDRIQIYEPGEFHLDAFADLIHPGGDAPLEKIYCHLNRKGPPKQVRTGLGRLVGALHDAIRV